MIAQKNNAVNGEKFLTFHAICCNMVIPGTEYITCEVVEMKMRHVHVVDYQKLWDELEEKLNVMADDCDWDFATSDSYDEQRALSAKKETCYEILDLMDSLIRHS